jgi:hypothetical protein
MRHNEVAFTRYKPMRYSLLLALLPTILLGAASSLQAQRKGEFLDASFNTSSPCTTKKGVQGTRWTFIDRSSTGVSDVCCGAGLILHSDGKCVAPKRVIGMTRWTVPFTQFGLNRQLIYCPSYSYPSGKVRASDKSPICIPFDLAARKTDRKVSSSALGDKEKEPPPLPTPPPWCGPDDDVSPPNPNTVNNCYNALSNTPLGQCLNALAKSAPSPADLDWPSQEEMEKCGCSFSHIDEQTSAKGRKFYVCPGPPELRVSPFNGRLGIMVLGTPGCMFDLEGRETGKPPGPVIPGENCFACHNRKDPEVANPRPCEPKVTPKPPSPPPPSVNCRTTRVAPCVRVRNRLRSRSTRDIRRDCEARFPRSCVSACVQNTQRIRCR